MKHEPGAKPEPAAGEEKQQADSGGRDRRRSQRIPYYNPLIVTWIRSDGVRIHEYAGAVDVSAHGCLLKMTTPVPVNAEVEIRHPRHLTHVRGKVVRILGSTPEGLVRVGVNLYTEGMVFWLLEALEDDGHHPTPLKDEMR